MSEDNLSLLPAHPYKQSPSPGMLSKQTVTIEAAEVPRQALPSSNCQRDYSFIYLGGHAHIHISYTAK